MKQLALIPDAVSEPKPDPQEVRLSRQCREILDMLRQAKRFGEKGCTAAELCTVSHRFGARIWDLRHKHKYKIEMVENEETGESWYRLKPGLTE
jgi:hypothetical protein